MSNMFMKSIVVVMLMLMIGSALIGSGIAVSAYNLIENGGSGVTRRSTLNFVNGGCVDNAGTLATDCTITTTIPSNISCAFTAQTSVVCTHNLNTLAVTVDVYDTSTPPLLILPKSLALTTVNSITVTFSVAQSGTIIVNGSQGAAAPASGFLGSSFVSTQESTSSTTFVQLATPDTTTFTLPSTVSVVIANQAMISSAGTPACVTQINVDGVDVASTANFVVIPVAGNSTTSLAQYKTSLAAGSHTVLLDYKVTASTCNWFNRLLTVGQTP